jgi:hypothetical protein
MEGTQKIPSPKDDGLPGCGVEEAKNLIIRAKCILGANTYMQLHDRLSAIGRRRTLASFFRE